MRWSWNDIEDDALQGLRAHTQVMYLRGIRKHMDYASGYAGYKRRLSYQQLAEAVGEAPDQGGNWKAAPLTKHAVRASVAELERAGLVERVPADRALIFRLPLADVDESAQKMNRTGTAQGEPHSEAHSADGNVTPFPQQGAAQGSADEPHGVNRTPPGSGSYISPNGDTSAAGPPPCPHEEIIALYHEILPMCPPVRRWNDARKGYLRSRWRESPKHQSLDFWRGYFEYVAQSPFLTGKVERDDKPPFCADLEWLVRSSNFTKVVEGKYHRGQQ
ncbi:MAG: hypothetical protein ABEH64_10165 [Salinirussus sp.]